VNTKYAQSDLGNFIGRFMADLEVAAPASQEPGPMEIYVHSRLVGVPHPPIAILDGLELWQVVSLSRSLGAAIQGELTSFEQLETEALDELETLGFSALVGGHKTLVAACRQMRSAHWDGNARNGCLQRVGRALRTFEMNDAVHAAASAIAQAAFATFPFNKRQKLFGISCHEAVLQHGNKARLELGIGKTIWNAFIASSPPWIVFQGSGAMHTIVDVQRAHSFFRGYLPFVSLRSAAKQHKISQHDIARLVAAGLVRPVPFEALNKLGPVYSLPAIQEAIGTLSSVVRSSEAANDNHAPDGFMSVAKTSKTFAIEVASIHKLIRSGGVDPVSPDSRRLGLGTEAQELAW
jgi:hypothetical protein